MYVSEALVLLLVFSHRPPCKIHCWFPMYVSEAINCFLSQTLSGEPLIVYEAKSQLTPIPAMCDVLECLLQAYYTMKLYGILVLLEISTTTGFFPYKHNVINIQVALVRCHYRKDFHLLYTSRGYRIGHSKLAVRCHLLFD